MSDALLPDVVERAIRVAARAHRTQTRKATDLPYIAHPAAVVQALTRAGFDQDAIVAAAWLHDVVEDTPVTIEEIRAEFPADVADIVETLSEVKHAEDGTPIGWKDRKCAHLAVMRTAGPAALAVMLADKLHNMLSMFQDARTNPQMWERFNAPRDEILWYYGAMIDTTDGVESLAALRSAAREALRQLDGASPTSAP